jgi:hypothetical protein
MQIQNSHDRTVAREKDTSQSWASFLIAEQARRARAASDRARHVAEAAACRAPHARSVADRAGG